MDTPSTTVICGSDPRLQSQYGTREGSGLRISGVPGVGHRVLYGPHLSLLPGPYRFELLFQLDALGEGLTTVDLTKSGGHRAFYLRRCFKWELERGLIRVSYSLEDPIEAFELRLYAGTGFSAVIDCLNIISSRRA